MRKKPRDFLRRYPFVAILHGAQPGGGGAE